MQTHLMLQLGSISIIKVKKKKKKKTEKKKVWK